MKTQHLAAILLVIVLAFSQAIASHMSKDSTTFTVTEKERVVTSEDSYYLVFNGVDAFKNSDDLWQLKFNSSTLHSQLQVGKTYSCDKNFWRVPLLSMYENLLSCKEVK